MQGWLFEAPALEGPGAALQPLVENEAFLEALQLLAALQPFTAPPGNATGQACDSGPSG